MLKRKMLWFMVWLMIFLYVTKYDIKRIIKDNLGIDTTGLHVGPLYIQPQSRNLNYNPKYENVDFVYK